MAAPAMMPGHHYAVEAPIAHRNEPCAFHCLDCHLLGDWLRSMGDYLAHIFRPCSTVGPCQLCRCRQPSWEAAFTEWSVTQFWLGVIAAAVVVAIDASHGHAKAPLFMYLAMQIFWTFVLAHLYWFAVVRKNGCCCCVVACCVCPPALLLWGLLGMVWGILSFLYTLRGWHDCSYCWVKPLIQALYAISLFYLGLSCFKIWSSRGKEVVPPGMEVKGPQGHIIGTRNPGGERV